MREVRTQVRLAGGAGGADDVDPRVQGELDEGNFASMRLDPERLFEAAIA